MVTHLSTDPVRSSLISVIALEEALQRGHKSYEFVFHVRFIIGQQKNDIEKCYLIRQMHFKLV